MSSFLLEKWYKYIVRVTFFFPNISQLSRQFTRSILLKIFFLLYLPRDDLIIYIGDKKEQKLETTCLYTFPKTQSRNEDIIWRERFEYWEKIICRHVKGDVHYTPTGAPAPPLLKQTCCSSLALYLLQWTKKCLAW